MQIKFGCRLTLAGTKSSISARTPGLLSSALLLKATITRHECRWQMAPRSVQRLWTNFSPIPQVYSDVFDARFTGTFARCHVPVDNLAEMSRHCNTRLQLKQSKVK